MRTDSISRFIFVSKPVTAAGVMVLVHGGRLSLLVNPCGTRNGVECQLMPAQRPFTVLDLMTDTWRLGDAGPPAADRRQGYAPNRSPALLRD